MRSFAHLLGFTLVLLVACSRHQEPGSCPNDACSPGAAIVTPHHEIQGHIETSVATPGSAHGVLSLAGHVAYEEDHYSRISSPVQGRVVEVQARLGDLVQTGDVLLLIESPEIAQAYSDFIREDSELDYAARSHQLAKDLYETKALSLKDLKQTENDLVKAQAEFRRAKERLRSLRIPAAEIDKSTAEQHITARFQLRSALTGTVVERTVTLGQSVGSEPDQVLFTIADLDTLEIVADVYERDLAMVYRGLAATVTVEAYPGEPFPAIVSAIGDNVDPHSRTIKIRARVNNAHRKLKPGMFARLNIRLDDDQFFIAVPREAVLVIDGTEYLYLMEGDGRFVKRAVKVSSASGDRVRVLKGVTDGDTIVTKGAVLLRAQTK